MKKRMTAQDLRRVKLDPRAMTEFNRKGAPASVLPASVLQKLRKLSRETIQLMKAQGSKITPEDWYRRLVNILKSRNPEVRKKIIAQLEARDAEDKK